MTYLFWAELLRHKKLKYDFKWKYLKIYSIKPKIIVYDMHPSFVYRDINLKYILNINEDVKIMETQHHHSHVVSCMVENDINEQVIGIAYDGTGYGDDKKI